MKKQKKMKISRLELVEMLSDRAEIPRSEADKVLNVMREIFKEAALDNKTILVRNFFKAEPYITKERRIRIPQTNKIIKTKPKRKIKIHIANTFIEEINKKSKNKKSKGKK